MSITGIQPFIDQISWETSEDKTHQFYICHPEHQAQFDSLVMQIKRNGYIVTLQGQAFICLDIGKYLYWTDWDSRRETSVIRRMPV